MMVSKLEEMNQSFAIKRFPFSKEDKRRETLTDLDCIAIREAKKKFEMKLVTSPILHLDDLIVDVSNMVAYRRFSPFGIVEFMLLETGDNDRTRSRLSSRKPLDSATADGPAASSFFAKSCGDYGDAWGLEYSGEKDNCAMPSARQLFAGLEACYRAALERATGGATNATLAAVLATYRRVFDSILALVAFQDPDQ